jgi:hypothetical protein
MRFAARPADFLHSIDRLPNRVPTGGAKTSSENTATPQRLSTVLAAHDEEAVIPESLQRICSEFSRHAHSPYALICINDGSARQFWHSHGAIRRRAFLCTASTSSAPFQTGESYARRLRSVYSHHCCPDGYRPEVRSRMGFQVDADHRKWIGACRAAFSARASLSSDVIDSLVLQADGPYLQLSEGAFYHGI